ncbi:ribonuclease HII [Moraxella bovis]|uniref:Ribonuclease n=1 Tax=Moraxella bovis TaxID=476 RepID=A0AAQ2Q739_MORBO|nr:ribonuclease HII [Moraxella bovis]AWY19786.1 ribonuclease HII [Moraxella bovis]UYZ75087.1 ribonuclease HII [Moraxella bovis]UYZ78981.1 ribonuclease HII [Moraxella bovis]UYZ87464.1 ribonuclease HII [Moraxella bovis]UYZ90201.1 ribonuclease HII [Moraxella bovis]
MIKAHTQNTHDHACTVVAHKNHEPTSRTFVIGIDEVGRGSLFGQMTVGAVILDNDLTGEFGQIDLTNTPLALINDSKKLSEKKRNLVFDPIKQACQSYVIIDIPAYVIDTIDIYQATLLGMRLAIENLIALNNISKNDNLIIVIDGNAAPTLSDDFSDFQPCIHTLIKGDSLHTSIACASILAKVHRDTVISDYAKIYPDYGLDKHKGYASKAHTTAIYEHGILPEHRKSFNPMRTILANQLF